MIRYCLFILLLSLTTGAFAQTSTIYGTVTDERDSIIPDVNVILLGKSGATTTNSEGQYRLKTTENGPLTLVFSYLQFVRDTVQINLAPGQSLQLDRQINVTKVLTGVVVEGTKNDVQDNKREAVSEINISVKNADYIPAPTQDIIALVLSQAVGTSKTNELSTQYTVRGGNFDENLVYVNGFEVYRPFLIRSGQQEGLSFINPDMVEELSFSAGGFQPKYGDKMASVLAATYKQPDSLAGSFSIGLLGGSAHLAGAIRNKQGVKKFTFLLGVRQKQNGYLLKGLETAGQYTPSFTDAQGFFTYHFNKKWSLEYITNYARNRFVFKPVDRETTFGVVNNVLRLTMYFEGQEDDSYQTLMNGLALVHKPNDNLTLRFMGSMYNSQEIESYDIIAEYFIGEVESDLSQDDFGQVRYNLGVGGIHTFARNRLEWTVANAEHQGFWEKDRHFLQWGVKYQREIINDKINEWERLDSAGHSLPYNVDQVLFNDVLKSTFDLTSNRYSGFLQDTWTYGDLTEYTLTYGARFSYWDVNNEFLVSPRLQFSVRPSTKKNRDVVFNAAVGMYQQPPFYREMRNLNGVVNTNLKAQKSIHAIMGVDYNFKMWKRDFKFITEIYYKHLYDLVPYEFDNVLIRYTGQNNATGYAAGIDFRLGGEFVKGTESYISMSFLKTAENLKNDMAVLYFDSTGARVPSSFENIASTDTIAPGMIPRPTDQRFVLNMFFQDYLPKNENFKVHLNFIVATGLPFGPPDNERYGDTLRIPAYRRVDIGFSAQLFGRKQKLEKIKEKGGKLKGFGKVVNSIWATFEVYNLLGINNTVSYLWVKDISNTSYAVPNFLTNRRFNLRLVVRFD